MAAEACWVPCRQRRSAADLRGTSLAEKHRDVLAEAGVVGAEPGVVGQQGFDALLPGLVGAALGCRERPTGGRGWGRAATPRKVTCSPARSRSFRAPRVRASASSCRRWADWIR